VASIVWDQEMAGVYDAVYASLAEARVVDPMVDVLAELAGEGTALEFGVGTGRFALALSSRGTPVSGIELSAPMVEQLRAKPGAHEVTVAVGDMTTTRMPGEFSLVYLVANSIMNVTTQDDQVCVFANAAQHLATGGSFVLEVMVPQLRLFPPGTAARVFAAEPHHVGIETLEDPSLQIVSSAHWFDVDGRLVQHSAPYRYVWPAELDLMAKLTGFRLRHRWAGWDRSVFTSDSDTQVVVYEKT
jgi:SAM-dependent methyltransferase